MYGEGAVSLLTDPALGRVLDAIGRSLASTPYLDGETVQLLEENGSPASS